MSQSYIKKEDVVGKKVIDANGNLYGTVKDIAFSLRGEIAMVVEKKDGGEEAIPLSRVSAIGEYILLKPSPAMPPPMGGRMPPSPGVPPSGTMPPSPGPPPGAPIVCPICGYENPPGSTYCQRCNASLPRPKQGRLGFLSKFRS